MGLYAEEKLAEAAGRFIRYDTRWRQGQAGAAGETELREILIDLDAAIPGLEGAPLGRALVLKAHALYYRWLSAVQSRKLLFYDPSAPDLRAPDREAWEAVTRGRALLAQHEPDSLSIADAVADLLRPYFEPEPDPDPSGTIRNLR